MAAAEEDVASHPIVQKDTAAGDVSFFRIVIEVPLHTYFARQLHSQTRDNWGEIAWFGQECDSRQVLGCRQNIPGARDQRATERRINEVLPGDLPTQELARARRTQCLLVLCRLTCALLVRDTLGVNSVHH